MSTDNPTAPASPAQQAVNAAISGLSTEVLKTERQARVEARLDVSAYDAALAARQTEPINVAVANDFAAHGVAQEPTGYSGANYNALRDLPPERLAAVKTETAGWASSLGFSRDVGEAIITRMAELGQRTAAMSDTERANWLAAQDKVSMAVAGGQKGLDALIEKATALLKERAGNSDVTKGLLASVVMRDAVLLRQIANHSDALRLVANKYKR